MIQQNINDEIYWKLLDLVNLKKKKKKKFNYHHNYLMIVCSLLLYNLLAFSKHKIDFQEFEKRAKT